ncbi:MAG: carbohydrate ABC transporter permease [Treponema sp.]|jgi:sn-glycerol 3-phosphate transport system permease protein|nr:carbohydrate ABC transporter permease [Treponema sp.]
MIFERKHSGLFCNLLLVCVSILFLFPLFWIIVTSMKGQAQALKYPLVLFPKTNMFMLNLREVWSRAAWLQSFKNTLVLTAGVWAAQMLVAIPAAYALGVMRFRGAGLLFVLILTRLLATPESTMLANYVTVVKLGAYDSLAGIALPYLLSAQAVFLFRGAFKQMPASLRDSAIIDGCGDFQFLIRVGIPLIKPFIAAFSVITGVFQWNAFFWPVLVTGSPSKRILGITLTFFGMKAESGSEWPLTMTAVLMVTAPLLIIFIIFQKKFINNIMKAWIY